MSGNGHKSPVRLNGDQEYAIYKYAIENHCLYQEGDITEYRVNLEKIAREINLLKIINATINGHHIKVSIEKVVAWQKRLDKLPAVPMETVELDQLKIFKTKATREIEELKMAIENQRKEIERLTKLGAHNVDDLRYKIDRLKAILLS